jgi:predicted ribosome quality control (RQC) complex YloA/Tae2 family protein
VPDFYTDAAGAMATIALDPARPPRETMEKLFRRAAKLERGRPHVQASIETNRQTIRKLEALLQEIEDWCEACKAAEEAPGAIPQEWIERSRALHVAPQELESIAPAPPPRSKKEERDAALRKGVRSFRSRDGWEILVGKSARDNDALTFRLARGNDWWFHLAPAAGSHVVARNPDGGRELPQETLLDAAHLAVHFSKMRNTDRADVTYAQAKHVRRIKGAPPGKVQVERPKTIFVRIEPARMERLTRGTR